MKYLVCFGILITAGGLLKLFAQPLDSTAIIKQARKDMAVLCSDSLAGRGYNHNGHRKAANYLAKRFAALGLKKASNATGYLQPFDFQINRISDATLQLDKKKLTIGIDFIVAANSAAGTCTAPVMALKRMPQDSIIRSQVPFIAVVGWNEPDSISKKYTDKQSIEQAKAAGAIAVIILKEKLTAAFSSETVSLPVLEVRKAAWPDNSSRSRHTRKFPATATLKVISEITTVEAENVVGYIPGTVYPDSFILLCAHFDHLGQTGSAIFRGGNDNASGTSFLLALAGQLVRQPIAYSVIIAAFGAEEAGLKGSLYYVQNPLFPLERLRYVLNFDLMGNGQAGVMAVGGLTYTQLYDQVKQINDSLTHINPFPARPNAPNSDHYPFTLVNIPALFFYTMGGPPHYHDVFDVPEGLALPVFTPMLRLITAVIATVHR
jgi:hypothetical protein